MSTPAWLGYFLLHAVLPVFLIYSCWVSANTFLTQETCLLSSFAFFSYFYCIIFSDVCVYVFARTHVCTHVSSGALGGQKHLIPVVISPQMWVVGTKLLLSGRAGRSLICRASLQTLSLVCFPPENIICPRMIRSVLQSWFLFLNCQLCDLGPFTHFNPSLSLFINKTAWDRICPYRVLTDLIGLV